MPKGDSKIYIPNVTAPPPELDCSDRAFATRRAIDNFDPNVIGPLFGLSSTSIESPTENERLAVELPDFPLGGIFSQMRQDEVPMSPMRVPQLHKLILDSGKLAKLDKLLPELKAGGHRVLVYFQMTRMIDLMEEYLSFRQYK